MKIRQEKIKDYKEVYELVKKSFATSTHADGTEPDYLNEVRKKDSFIPELSLVVENDGRLIGQIVLYKTIITSLDKEITELLLSPICVHPDFFRQGIARAMMKKAFQIANKMGYSAVFLCGDPNFYHKIGFRPTYEFGIFHINDESKKAEWCMVRELKIGALKNIKGTVNTN
ncbi:GNAT family N-acetyltransferase [Clostridium estertheticum]|uniref:GNAT family N-acetyltransferase n=1 Tax=Clostridium estertheticum TaxID=238834 RepID=UPI001CF546B9|nr:N-acetyltransferase [Clostridium estertheticum]MCB2361676.1 N-acetyltransferase [Clostridium estertheticum]